MTKTDETRRPLAYKDEKFLDSEDARPLRKNAAQSGQ